VTAAQRFTSKKPTEEHFIFFFISKISGSVEINVGEDKPIHTNFPIRPECFFLTK
jgi:hypothetical protein